MPASRLRLVVPCYDEERRLRPEVFLGALEEMPRLDFRFVDDGSRDGTRAVLEGLREAAPTRVSVLGLDENSGKAEAVRRGVLASLEEGAALVGYWDADLATPFSELPAFLEVLDHAPEVDVALGSRVKLLGREIERRFHRHLYGRVFSTVVSVMLGLPVYDTQCGAKVLRNSPALHEAFAERFRSRWIFDVEMMLRLVTHWRRGGLDPARKAVEVPLRVWRDVPGSKVGVKDALRAGVELVELRRRYGAPGRT